HEVDVEQRRELGRRLDRQVPLHRGELAGDGVARAAQALDLSLDVFAGDVVVSDVQPARRDQHGATDRDASRDGQAEELETHGTMLAARRAMRPRRSTMRARTTPA